MSKVLVYGEQVGGSDPDPGYGHGHPVPPVAKPPIVIQPLPPVVDPPPSWNPPPWGSQLPVEPDLPIVVPQPPDKPKPPDFPSIWPPIPDIPEKSWVAVIVVGSGGKHGHWVYVDKTKPVEPPTAQPKRG